MEEKETIDFIKLYSTAADNENLPWLDPDKFKDYVPVEDRGNIFNFTGIVAEFNTDDYIVMAGANVSQTVVLYRIPATVNIVKNSGVADEDIENFISGYYNLEESMFSVQTQFPNEKTKIRFSDEKFMNRDLAMKLYSELCSRNYIKKFEYIDTYYNGQRVHLSTSYPKNALDDIAKVLVENNIDAEVVKSQLGCSVKFHSTATAVEIIELYNLIYEKTEEKPLAFYLPLEIIPVKIPLPEVFEPELATSPSAELGDINADGSVDITDLTELSVALVDNQVLTENQIKAADINMNGKADLTDLATLKQYLSKMITSL